VKEEPGPTASPRAPQKAPNHLLDDYHWVPAKGSWRPDLLVDEPEGRRENSPARMARMPMACSGILTDTTDYDAAEAPSSR
jgi:hypothetical protein